VQTRRTGDQPVARPVPTKESTTQKDEDKHAPRVIRTRDPNVKAAKTQVIDRAATEVC
jgi:hypothetical protein